MLPTCNIIVYGADLADIAKINTTKADRFIVENFGNGVMNLNTNEGVITLNPIFVNDDYDTADLKHIDGAVIFGDNEEHEQFCQKFTDNIIHYDNKKMYFDNPFVHLMRKIRPDIHPVMVRRDENRTTLRESYHFERPTFPERNQFDRTTLRNKEYCRQQDYNNELIMNKYRIDNMVA